MPKVDLFTQAYKAFFKKHKKPSSIREFARLVLRNQTKFTKATVKRARDFLDDKEKYDLKIHHTIETKDIKKTAAAAAAVSLGNPIQYHNQGVVHGTGLRATPVAPLHREDDLFEAARHYLHRRVIEPPPVRPRADAADDDDDVATPHPPSRRRKVTISTPHPKVKRSPAVLLTKEGLEKVKTLSDLKAIFRSGGAPELDIKKLTAKNKTQAIDEFLAYIQFKGKKPDDEDSGEESDYAYEMPAAGVGSAIIVRQRDDFDMDDDNSFQDQAAYSGSTQSFRDWESAVAPSSHWSGHSEEHSPFTAVRHGSVPFNKSVLQTRREENIPVSAVAAAPTHARFHAPSSIPRPTRLQPTNLFGNSDKMGPG